MSARAGRLFYFRHKGAMWTDVARAWMTPAIVGAAGTKYLGLEAHWAVLLWCGIAVATEGLAVLIGWWAHRTGVTEAEYRLAADRDPYKRESIQLLTEIRDTLRQRRR